MNKFSTISAIALTTTMITGVMSPPASAQVIELLSIAGSALNSLTNRNQQQPPQQQQYQQYYQPSPSSQPLPNRNWTIGTNNLNSNNLNFCLLTCPPTMPQGTTSSAIPTQRTYPPSNGVAVQGQVMPNSNYPNGVAVQGQVMPNSNYPNGVAVQGNQQIMRSSNYPNGVAVPGQQVMGNTNTATSSQINSQSARPTIIIPPIRLPINMPR